MGCSGTVHTSLRHQQKADIIRKPTVMQAAVVRTPASLERWGENVDVVWAVDGRGLIILVRLTRQSRNNGQFIQTSTSHILFYQLRSTSKPSYGNPPTSIFPPGGGPGEGDILMGWKLASAGVAFVMGGCSSILPLPHTLILTLRHPPCVLTVTYPIPSHLLATPGSHFPPTPLDGNGGDQVDSDVWDLSKGRDWMVWNGKFPVSK